MGQGDKPEPGVDALRVGVSMCLLGAKVRFDGQHKRDGFLVDVLGPYVQWVAVCPEIEAGMSIPRPTVRLVRNKAGKTLMIAPDSGEDWTARMERFAHKRTADLDDEDLDGYVLKKASPSCGMERVKLYPPAGDNGEPSQPSKDGVGLFAAALLSRFPNLPVEEEGRLEDPALRENFIERLFAYKRLKALWAQRWTVGALVAFHTAHKLTLMAHSPEAYKSLGQLVAGAKAMPRAQLRERYETEFMAALKKRATPGRHANVMQHMAGYLRPHLDADDRNEVMSLIDDHRRGQSPLIVPLTLLKHHIRRHNVEYLLGQTYLQPHPKELMLRNRV
ncbi:MAG: DUF523 and DUF1722 domain-containing protein [Deltaproteobacteria bacterium]|nr:DUF523 and DUF1722 domain-containing protein [Deltaproteobacteria bacterium]